MKSFKQIPLYLGFFVLILSVLVSTIKLSQNRAITLTNTSASLTGAILNLTYSAPQIVSVSVTSNNDIVGADITLKYDPKKITILPSTLTSVTFITTGGTIDEVDGTFSFSAVTENVFRNGFIATFSISPKEVVPNENIDIDFATFNNQTAVFAKNSMENILVKANGLTFQLGK